MTADITKFAIHINEKDNVVTALTDVKPGHYFFPDKKGKIDLEIKDEIKAGFKICIAHLKKGEKVYKFGYTIGVASSDIRPGDKIHIENLASKIW